MAVTIGKAIKIIREAQGKSLGALAESAAVSVPYLSLLEGDKRNPSLDVIKRLADALAVPEDVFLLIGCGQSASLSSSSEMTSRLVSILQEMESFEERLRDAVSEQ